MTSHHIEFGLDTPVYVTVDDDGRPLTGDVVIRNTVEEAVLADAVGIDSFNIGEHYRPELMDSAGAVMLGAIAGRTERIRLGTAVTVLSTQDPVRVYTEFATLDAVSNGRAQLIVGRGSLTDSFPLFGFDLADYEKLFEENLDLLTHLLRDQPVTWSGSSRSPLTAQHVSPPLPEGHYWEPTDGIDEELAKAPAGTSVVVQDTFPSARVVKSLNQLGYHDYDEGKRRLGAPDRIAVAAAGDDCAAVAALMQLIDRLGFDAVDAGGSGARARAGRDSVRTRHPLPTRE